MLPDKWQFDISQDWEVPGDDFDSVSLETIPDATLQALGFHYSPLGYLEEGAPRFVGITDKPELAIEEPKGDVGPIMDSKDEKARKVSERTAKRKVQRNNLCAPIRKALAAGSATPSSSHPPMPTPLSCPESPTPSPSHLPVLGWLSRPSIPGLLSRPPVFGSSSGPLVAGLLSLPVPAPLSLLVPAPLSPPMPASLSLLVPALLSRSIFGPAPTRLTSSALRTFKQALSDEPLSRQLTSPSPAEPLCPFLTLGPWPEKSDCKRPFDIAFINSHPLAGNHAAEEVDLSFGKCRCPTPVKLIRT